MKKKVVILIIVGLFAFFIVAISSALIFYNTNLGCVDENAKENIEFTVSKGEATSTIIQNLENKKIIKNAFVLKIYAKLNPGVPQAGNYIFTKKMTAKEVYSAIINGKATYDTVWVTFIEGKRLTYIANQISAAFGYNIDDINSTLDDKEYIKELISKYDILTDDILKEDIIHPLEGYLFPETYEFLSTASIKDIIEKMLATTESKLSAYQKEIDENKLSIHEIMTLASLVETEGMSNQDRNGIAGVFMNRINDGWSLGSDATTLYSANKEFGSPITMSNLRICDAYNTSSYGCRKGLPAGPIATSSMQSLLAAINPTKHDYYYFVSDKNGKIYFTKNESEHQKIIKELRDKGLWLE